MPQEELWYKNEYPTPIIYVARTSRDDDQTAPAIHKFHSQTKVLRWKRQAAQTTWFTEEMDIA